MTETPADEGVLQDKGVPGSGAWQSALTMLQSATPPHRHSGPAFGYMLEGEMWFELEGEAPRVIKAGEPFWEPGGDVIHYRDGNNRSDIASKFVVTMLGVPGQPMFVVVEDDELEQRKDRRVPPRS